MTPETQPAPTKVCIRCGIDCAGKPRTKDAAGNYVCGSCVAALRAARSPAAQPPPVADAPPEPAAPAPSAGPLEPPAISLSDDAPIPLDADPIGLSEPIAPPRTCGGCGLLMAAGAVVCTACGFDIRTNSIHAGPAGQGPKCFNCGYSLVGLKAKTARSAGRPRAGASGCSPSSERTPPTPRARSTSSRS